MVKQYKAGGDQKKHSRIRLWLAWAVQYWRELLNFRFDKYVIVQVLPGVYGMLLVGIALSLLFFTVVAFNANFWYGLYFLLIVTPLGFLVSASILRALIEFYLVVFRISEKVDELVGIRDTVERFSGIGETVDQMVSVTRKIPFGWLKPSTVRDRQESDLQKRERRQRHEEKEKAKQAAKDKAKEKAKERTKEKAKERAEKEDDERQDD